jgi:hypothetical protein
MSNQEPQNQNKTTEDAGVEKRRRFIKGAGIAAPVVLTLANRSAFGQTLQCLSQQVSGNISQVGAGSCASAASPSTWQPPTPTPQPAPVVGQSCGNITAGSTQNRTILTLTKTVKVSGAGVPSGNCTLTISYQSTPSQVSYPWHGTPYVYGLLTTSTPNIGLTYKSGNKTKSYNGTFTIASVTGDTTPPLTGLTLATGNSTPYIISGTTGVPIRTVALASPKLYSDFTGGTTFNAAFGYAAHNSTLTNTSMREILSTAGGTLDAYCVTALLNAVFYSNASPPYVLTVNQVIGLCAPAPSEKLPPGTSLSAFLASTWLNMP